MLLPQSLVNILIVFFLALIVIISGNKAEFSRRFIWWLLCLGAVLVICGLLSLNIISKSFSSTIIFIVIFTVLGAYPIAAVLYFFLQLKNEKFQKLSFNKKLKKIITSFILPHRSR